MKRYLPLVIAAVAAVLFVRLGIWQLHRLGERRARNAQVAAKMAGAVYEVDAVGRVDVDSLAYRRGRATGRFDFDHQFIEVLKPRDGIPGVFIVTPLVLDSTRAVLVERGWYPSPDGKAVPLATLEEPDSTTVEGLLLAPYAGDSLAPGDGWPRYVRAADPALLAGGYGRRLFPLLLRRTTLPAGTPAGLDAIRPPELSEGPHLSYAIQWFSFAVIALVGSTVLVLKREVAAGDPKGADHAS